MVANSSRTRKVFFLGMLLAASMLVSGSANVPKASAACADTVLVRTVKRYSLTSGAQVVHLDTCTAIAVPGRRFLLEVLRPGGANSLDSARVNYDDVEYFGTHDIDTPNVLLSRIFAPIGADTLKVTLFGSAGAKLDIRITQVSEPSYQVAGQSGFNGATSVADKWYTRYFSPSEGVPAGPHVMTLKNGDSNGNARTLGSEVWLNSQQIIFPGEVTRGRAYITRNVTLEETNTLEVKLQGNQSGKTMSVKFYGTDVTPPAMVVVAPADSIVTRAAKALATVQLADSQTGVRLRLNGAEKALTNGAWSDSLLLPQVDGPVDFTFSSENGSCLTGTVTRTVIRDTSSPVLELASPAEDTTVTVGSLSIHGSWNDANKCLVVLDEDTLGFASHGTLVSQVQLDMGATRIRIVATDPAGNTTTLVRTVFRMDPNESAPSDTNAFFARATPIHASNMEAFASAVSFLYSGQDPPQSGAIPESLDSRRIAVIRGQTQARDWTALPNVSIDVLAHPEFGSTKSREDGSYDLAVNGGSSLTLRFRKQGYLEAHRRVTPDWNRYCAVPRVSLVGISARFSVVDSTQWSITRARVASDLNGDRSISAVFPRGTIAKYIDAQGDTVALSRMRVRASELTIGPDGPQAMPADLTPATAYTYCVDLRIDEADSLEGSSGGLGSHVTFTKPVALYLRNFLHLPVGTRVPVGYYDAASGHWVGMPDGVVAKIVAMSSDGAIDSIDTRGTGHGDPQSRLDSLGVVQDELATLGSQFAVGDTVWRVTTQHFSMLDFNWPFVVPTTAAPPGEAPYSPPFSRLPCEEKGSIVLCEDRILGERLGLVGTPVTLNYWSYRAPGDAEVRSVTVPVTPAVVPPFLQKIAVKLEIAGRVIEHVIDGPILGPVPPVTLVWDGYDCYKRWVPRATTGFVSLGYFYGLSYGSGAGTLTTSFGSPGGTGALISGSGDRRALTALWSRRPVTLGVVGTEVDGLGGWTFGNHHIFDPQGAGCVYLGDGTMMRGDQLRPNLRRLTAGTYPGDGQCSPSEPLPPPDLRVSPSAIVVGGDGSLYIADNCRGAIVRVRPDGATTRIAGQLTPGNYAGDGPALNTPLKNIRALALDESGNIYFAMGSVPTTNNMVGKVTPGGKIVRIIGANPASLNHGGGDGGSVGGAWISNPTALAVDTDGSLYIGDHGPNLDDDRVRRIAADGTITTYAGNGQVGITDAVDIATALPLKGVDGLALDGDHNLYIAAYSSTRVFVVSPAGIRRTFVNLVNSDAAGQYNADSPTSVACGPDRSVYVAASNNWLWTTGYRVYRVGTDGVARTIAGGGPTLLSDGSGATAAWMYPPSALAVASDGSYYFVSGKHIWRGGTPTWVSSGAEYRIANKDGSEVYHFSATPGTVGRHLRTSDALTGAVRWSFAYDADGRIRQLTDGVGLTTTVQRGANGGAVGVLGPFGHRMRLSSGANGFLRTVTDSLGNVTTLTTDDLGILTEVRDAEGHSRTFLYDASNRLQYDVQPSEVGGRQELQMAFDGVTRTVTHLTPEGRQTTYSAKAYVNGLEQHAIVGSNGLRTVYTDSTNSVRRTVLPHGTTARDSVVVDPRLKPSGEYASRTTAVLPSGLAHTVDVTRIVDAGYDPPSVGGLWKEETRVSGKPPAVHQLSADSLMTRSSSPEGRVSAMATDALGRPRASFMPGTDSVHYAYGASGGLIRSAQGAWALRMAYNDRGLCESVSDTLGHVTQYSYDALGGLQSIQSADTALTIFGRDGLGRMRWVEAPDRARREFTYTATGYPETAVPPAGVDSAATREWSYNRDGQRTGETLDGVQHMTATYEVATGRMQQLQLPIGQVAYAYVAGGTSGAGMLASVAAPDSIFIYYTYDGDLPKKERCAGRVLGEVAVTYDRSFRVVDELVNGTQSITTVYDNDDRVVQSGGISFLRGPRTGWLDSTAVGGTVNSSVDYDNHGAVANLHYAWPGGSFGESIARDPAGRIARRTVIMSGVSHTYDYEYSAVGRLRRVIKDGTLVERYDYDRNGARSGYSRAGGGDTATTLVDQLDRVWRQGGASYIWNKNGDQVLRRTANGDTVACKWDGRGGLIEWVGPAARVRYLLDGHAQRRGRLENGRWTNGWIWWGERIAAECDSSGGIVTRFVYGSDSRIPDAMIQAGVLYRLVRDVGGSVRTVVEVATGTVMQALEYDSWGNVVSDTRPGFQPFGFQGGQYDHVTGLVRFGRREYDPRLGMWLSPDDAAPAAGLNAYAFCDGDPIGRTDPNGLWSASLGWGYAVGVGLGPLPGFNSGSFGLTYSTSGTWGWTFQQAWMGGSGAVVGGGGYFGFDTGNMGTPGQSGGTASDEYLHYEQGGGAEWYTSWAVDLPYDPTRSGYSGSIGLPKVKGTGGVGFGVYRAVGVSKTTSWWGRLPEAWSVWLRRHRWSAWLTSPCP